MSASGFFHLSSEVDIEPSKFKRLKCKTDTDAGPCLDLDNDFDNGTQQQQQQTQQTSHASDVECVVCDDESQLPDDVLLNDGYSSQPLNFDACG